MAKNNNTNPVQPEIKEGKESGPLTTKKESTDQKAYPRKSEKDIQHDNQPEFIEGENVNREKR